jgi:hypothetical protein
MVFLPTLEAVQMFSPDIFETFLQPKFNSTGKSFSEALILEILESVNPKHDERLFLEIPEKYKFTTCCVQLLF